MSSQTSCIARVGRTATVVAALLALVLTLASAADAADKKAETRAQLKQLRNRIESVRDQLQADRQQRDQTSAELARLEKRIGSTANKIDRLDTRMRQTRQKLDRLASRRKQLQKQLESHRATLATQLRAAHRFGRQPTLRLLLRQQEPGTLARALGYYGYFNRARLDAIQRARALVTKLASVTEETRAARAELAEARAGLESQRKALQDTQAQRQRVLAKLRSSISQGGDQLERLEASRERLEQLLKKLNTVMGDIPAAPLEEKPFVSRKHQLRWPLKGKLRADYGDNRAGGRMRWRGLVIDADPGSTVHAVYHGRVVFADWLEGFGQLIIIDHLDGYLSLYGYNRQLLRSTGDWVTPGEPIARVGASGGQRQAGLYFEIRHNGQPVDPDGWLAAR